MEDIEICPSSFDYDYMYNPVSFQVLLPTFTEVFGFRNFRHYAQSKTIIKVQRPLFYVVMLDFTVVVLMKHLHNTFCKRT